ncbi:tetraspanin-15 [Brachionus plicatilis]|uniref:Tetraspanin-15 n=1 Tax=Brachionus plicatilis TaxID=10195 RepID=A0A3M7PFH1_BRAPC|nr:tetraspanin-15 [Brachionus plicatilis]
MYEYTFNRANCTLSSITIFALISSLGLFLTHILLITTNSQFIAFNEFSSTGKTPAIFFYISIILTILYFFTFFVSLFGIWSTNDILNQWNHRVKFISYTFFATFGMMGLLQISSGITTVVYMKTMPGPLKEHMADNLRSNYTGGFGMGFLERQFDRSVDWVQINYQCCGVVSYEDYRNGFYYNSFNKYTIVNIVPNSCCMFKEANMPSKCQMQSINIFRKGCYDILMWWMESFGILISCLCFIFGFIYIILSLIFIKVINQIKSFKIKIREKNLRKMNKQKMKNLEERFSEANTTNDSISLAESRN